MDAARISETRFPTTTLHGITTQDDLNFFRRENLTSRYISLPNSMSVINNGMLKKCIYVPVTYFVLLQVKEHTWNSVSLVYILYIKKGS
jgi:hypothetical protein